MAACAVPAVFPRPPRPGSHRFLPVLRTAHQAHTLPTTEAIKGYPVHLDRAQITFYDPAIPRSVYHRPTTASSWTTRGDQVPDLHAGDVVEVDAVSGPGDVERSFCTRTFAS